MNELNRRMLDLQQQLAERTDDLAAERAANRELMTELTADQPPLGSPPLNASSLHTLTNRDPRRGEGRGIDGPRHFS